MRYAVARKDAKRERRSFLTIATALLFIFFASLRENKFYYVNQP